MPSNFRSYFKKDIGTSNNTVYNPTTPGIQSTVIGFSLCNTTNNTIQVSATFSRGGNSATVTSNSVYLVKNVVIPSGSSLVVVGGDQKLVMVANSTSSDFLEVSSNTSTSVDAMVSVLEVT